MRLWRWAFFLSFSHTSSQFDDRSIPSVMISNRLMKNRKSNPQWRHHRSQSRGGTAWVQIQTLPESNRWRPGPIFFNISGHQMKPGQPSLLHLWLPRSPLPPPGAQRSNHPTGVWSQDRNTYQTPSRDRSVVEDAVLQCRTMPRIQKGRCCNQLPYCHTTRCGACSEASAAVSRQTEGCGLEQWTSEHLFQQWLEDNSHHTAAGQLSVFRHKHFLFVHVTNRPNTQHETRSSHMGKKHVYLQSI